MDRKSILIFQILFTFCINASIGQCEIGKSVALFFAVSDYSNNQKKQEWPNLEGPIQEAQALAQLLIQKFDFEVHLFENPNREAILTAINQLKERSDVGPNDQLLLFFSGHGEKGYFIPKDGQADHLENTAIHFNQSFFSSLNEMPFFHQLLILDACYSGSILRSRNKGPKGFKRPNEGLSTDILLSCHQVKRTRFALTSAGSNYKSPEKSKLVKNLMARLQNSKEDEVIHIYQVMADIVTLASSPILESFYPQSHVPSANFLFIPKKILHQHRAVNHTCNIGKINCSGDQSIECLLCPELGHRIYPIGDVLDKQWITQNLSYELNGKAKGYNGNNQHVDSLGRLYNWEDADAVCRAIGQGWTLPSRKDWINLFKLVNQKYFEKHPKQKEKFTPKTILKSFNSLQTKKNQNSRDIYNEAWQLSMGGYRDSDGRYKALNKEGYYWTSDFSDQKALNPIAVQVNPRTGVKLIPMYKKVAASCLCVKPL